MSCTISFWTFVFHELYHLFLDSVDQLLALDQSGLASLLVFPVTDACDCAQTVRQRLVQRIDNLFCSLLDPVWSADWTEHDPATMHVLKDSGACFFWLCAFVAQWIVWATPRPLLSGIGVPKGHQNRAPTLCGCWSVVLWIRADTSKQIQRDCTLLFIESNCIAYVRAPCSVSNDNS